MKSRRLLELENRFLRLTAKGGTVLAGPYGGMTVLITSGEEVEIAAEILDLSPTYMKDAIAGMDLGPSISFYDLPRLTVEVSKPGMPDVRVDAAAAMMAAWHHGHGHLFDELCVNVWDEWLGYPGAAIAGPVALRHNGMPAAESGDDFRHVEVTVSRRSFSGWLRKLRSSDDEDIAHFGRGLTRSYRHFRNHDLEGNRYNRAGEIVENDGVTPA